MMRAERRARRAIARLGEEAQAAFRWCVGQRARPRPSHDWAAAGTRDGARGGARLATKHKEIERLRAVVPRVQEAGDVDR
jgi:hypothetical protein